MTHFCTLAHLDVFCVQYKFENVPWVAGWKAITCFVMLTLISVTAPLKAIYSNNDLGIQLYPY